MNITNFFFNPIGETLSAYTDILGMYFYGIVASIIGIYILIKTDSWQSASASFILMALLFSAIIPAYIIFIWAVCVAMSFTFLLIDVFVLK